MNSLLWNYYGASKAGFIKNINYLIRTNFVTVLTLFETKIVGSKVEGICDRICLPKCFRIEGWRYLAVWDDDHVDLQIVNPQQHFVRTKIIASNRSFQFIFAYAPPSVYRRRYFWYSLKDDLNCITNPVIASGDINCIIDSRLIDMGLSGQNFTWARGNSVLCCEMLDRVLLDSFARVQWPKDLIRHLPKFRSDHTPLLLCFKPPANLNRCHHPFRFEAA
ncbi:hypothetical protein V2J09_008550 [Rumex salicifolius]